MGLRIESFSGPYRFLSNFYPCCVVYEGFDFPSSENAYQWAKSKESTSKFQNCSAAESKRLGREIPVSIENWNIRRDIVMRDVVHAKFDQNENLKQMLISTGNSELIEGNYWGDTYWGQCPIGKGKNKLGKLLMSLRNSYFFEQF